MATQKEQNYPRLNDAIKIMLSIPDENVDLVNWLKSASLKDKTPTCGTIACAGGWFCMHPAFMRQGLQLDSGRYSAMPIYADSYGYQALADFFGISFRDAEFLFRYRSSSEHLALYSPNTEREVRKLTDRQLWLFRATKFLSWQINIRPPA